MFQDGMSESLEAAYMEPIKLGTLVKWEQETTGNQFCFNSSQNDGLVGGWEKKKYIWGRLRDESSPVAVNRT